jgi:excisionase family DNA binding protein
MEAARELNMSAKKLRELQKAGRIRATLNGRNWMFTSQELERYARGEPPP